jgi:hypothetical protein
VGQLDDVGAIGIHHVDVDRAIDVAEEGQARAVGRPLGHEARPEIDKRLGLEVEHADVVAFAQLQCDAGTVRRPGWIAHPRTEQQLEVRAVGLDRPQPARLAEAVHLVVAPDEGDPRAVGRPGRGVRVAVEFGQPGLAGTVAVDQVQVARGRSAARERDARAVGRERRQVVGIDVAG